MAGGARVWEADGEGKESPPGVAEQVEAPDWKNWAVFWARCPLQSVRPGAQASRVAHGWVTTRNGAQGRLPSACATHHTYARDGCARMTACTARIISTSIVIKYHRQRAISHTSAVLHAWVSQRLTTTPFPRRGSVPQAPSGGTGTGLSVVETRTRQRPKSVRIPRPRPVSVQRSFTTVGRARFGNAFSSSCAMCRVRAGSVVLRAMYLYAWRSSSFECTAWRAAISRLWSAVCRARYVQCARVWPDPHGDDGAKLRSGGERPSHVTSTRSHATANSSPLIGRGADFRLPGCQRNPCGFRARWTVLQPPSVCA